MVELAPCQDLGEWDRLLEGQPRATVFHRSEWLTLVERLAGAKLHPFLVTHGGSVVGVVPVYLSSRGPFRIAASPPAQAATPYLGPVVDDALLADTLVALARTAKRLKASYMELRLEEDVPATVLGAAQLDREARSTFVLDLADDPDVVWHTRLTPTCRNKIRKAQRADVEVYESKLADLVEWYSQMVHEVYAKSNRLPPLTRANYDALAEVVDQSNQVKVLAARRSGSVIAAGIFPFGNGRVYYLDGASDRDGQQWAPNNLIQWELIRWSCQAGLRHYHMVSAGTTGVVVFKQSFGPTEVPYTYCFRSLTPMAGLARSAYALLAPTARSLRYRLVRGPGSS